MKTAVPVTKNNQVDDHFGHCEYYNIYTLAENGLINDVQTIPSTQGCGCKSNIAGILASHGVTLMLAGGIGGGAINVLNHSGIEVIRGCSGNAAEVIKNYSDGKIKDSGESCLHHQHHHYGDQHNRAGGHGHSCKH